MDDLRAAIMLVLGEIRPATVRQTYYQLVSRGFVAKTEKEYKQTVVRLLTEMRLDGTLPFDWLADNTRWMRKPRSYSSLADMLDQSQQFYRRALWDNQDAYVELWLEKDALAGVLYEETSEYDVPLMVTRGYASISYLHESAEVIAACGKPAYLYYFGDFDPSGCDIPRTVESRLREFAPQAEIHFKRVAVTREQIEEFSLPTRPTKSTDSRSKNFEGESVEVDAIPPADLRTMARNCIVQHINPWQFQQSALIQESERQTLRNMAGLLENGDLA